MGIKDIGNSIVNKAGKIGKTATVATKNAVDNVTKTVDTEMINEAKNNAIMFKPKHFSGI